MASRFPAHGSSASPGRHNHTVPAASVRETDPGADVDVVGAGVVVVVDVAPALTEGPEEHPAATTAASIVATTAVALRPCVAISDPLPPPRHDTTAGQLGPTSYLW